MTTTSTERRPMAAEDLYEMQMITGADLSPDGRYVVYSQQRVNRKDEKKFTNLWLIDTEKGETRQFTYGDHTDSSPKWSPDGRLIAFLSNRADEKSSQIYTMPADGGEARPVTEFEGQIGGFQWSPDSSRFVVMFQKKDPQEKEREEDETKKTLGVVDRRITRAFFRSEGTGYEKAERMHIWTVDAASGDATQLTEGEYDEYDPSWSPDGKQILFLSDRNPNWDRELLGADLYLLPAGGGEMRKIPTLRGNKSTARFSPDGRQIAFRGGRFSPGQWWQNETLFVVPTDPADGPYRDLTSRHDFDLGSSTTGDFGSPSTQSPPIWSADGQYIYNTASRHGADPLFRVRVSDGEMEPVIDDGTLTGFFSFDQNQTRMVYFQGSQFAPGQLFLRQMGSGETGQLTRINEAFLSQIDMGSIEEVWFKGSDDNDLQGWILTPPGFDPMQTYPSILYIHGGPQVQYGRNFFHEFFYLAGQGYVVYYTNPRGGQGYGEEHAKAISGRWGTVDYDDLMAWTDYVAQKPYIDVERMGVCGGSYGGYMTGMIVGKTDRFKAAVPQRMVSNLVSFHGTSDFNWGVKYLVGIDGEPWNKLDEYWSMSPMSLVGNVKTPTLVIHSESDLRCAQEQGEQYFVALRLRGVETELVLFPGESHGLSRGGRTDRRVSRLKHICRWFDTYLKEAA